MPVLTITKNIEVPTGNILVVNADKGQLEMLSLGDYSKDVNLKADFLGLKRDIEQVKHTALLPLTEKWVVTISTQYGCKANCKFCQCPKIKYGGNATCKDLVGQVQTAMALHPEITYTNRLNIHYARMGEPSFNNDVLYSAVILHWKYNEKFNLHPVVSTMMPRFNSDLEHFIQSWVKDIKNTLYNGNAGLQLSINSTSNKERDWMFNGLSLDLDEISIMMEDIVKGLKGRKVTLNFAIADWEIDADKLVKYFDPRYFLVKLTPMHKTEAAESNNIRTPGDYTTYYPYKKYEEELKKVGFDVLVFIASEYEDLGRITCGNVILSGQEILAPHKIVS